MHRLQFSLKTLAGVVAFAAISCCALVYASSTWAATLFTAAIAFLAFATLATVYRQGPARAFWLGCAFCGWLYLLLIFGPISGTRHLNENGRPNRDSELATMHVARWIYQTVLPKLRQPPQTTTSVIGFIPGGMSGDGGYAEVGMSGSAMPGMPAGVGVGVPVTASFHYPSESDFIRVSHALWTWLLALVGGAAGQWLYSSKRAAEKPTAESP